MSNNLAKNIVENGSIPEKKSGIGLRSPHLEEILKDHKKIVKDVGFFEVHSENYYAKGGPSLSSLEKVRANFPISLHSVGNSLGSAQGLDLEHLKKLKNLIEIIDPFLVSDHISWGMVDNAHHNDLLPLPYNKESLAVISQNISQMQDFLKREILLENPSTYIAFKNPEMDEAEFINQLTKNTGCKLLLDVNNVFVSANNNKDFDAEEYLKKLDKNIVEEMHLAGHYEGKVFDGKNEKPFLIDTHNDVVCEEVWSLYKIAKKRFGKVPTLIEWDQDFPSFKVLLDEAKKAEEIF